MTYPLVCNPATAAEISAYNAVRGGEGGGIDRHERESLPKPLAFNGTWPSWNSDLDNRPW